MKLCDARENYYVQSGKLSDVTRQLSLAGIAVIWIFRSGDKTAAGIAWSNSLLWPLAYFVIALVCDVAQYAYASAAWGIFHRRKERELRRLYDGRKEFKDEIFSAPAAINRPTLFFFWSKTVTTLSGHLLLLKFLIIALCK